MKTMILSCAENTNIEKHIKLFKDYADSEIAKEIDDAGPMHLKIDHTFHVLENARQIAASLDCSQEIKRACILGGLYHDIARFEQYLLYRTFKDKVSCDHGKLGLKILKRMSCLSTESRQIRGLVHVAVSLHNCFSLPTKLAKDAALVTNVVRDADKLDILRIMSSHLHGSGPCNPTIVLSLPDDPKLCCQKVVKTALAGCIASYSDLKSVNDFRVLLGTWLFDLNSSVSRHRFAKDGHARSILLGLPQNELYGVVRSFLLDQLDNAE